MIYYLFILLILFVFFFPLRSYLGMTIHWLNSKTLERHSAGIACRRLHGRHTYDVLAETIENILSQYQILDKTLHCITDNATNFPKAFK